jgi:hypothetical protein
MYKEMSNINSPRSTPSNTPSIAFIPPSAPTFTPAYAPSKASTAAPTNAPTMINPNAPTSSSPSFAPAFAPTFAPRPTFAPASPTSAPASPAQAPVFNSPAFAPSRVPPTPPSVAPSFAPAFAPSRVPPTPPSVAPAFAPAPAYMPAVHTPAVTQYGPASFTPSYQGITVPPPAKQEVTPTSPSSSYKELSPAFLQATLIPNETPSTSVSTKPPTNAAGYSTNKIIQAEQVSQALYSYNSPIYKSLIGGFSKDSLVGRMSNLYSQINK